MLTLLYGSIDYGLTVIYMRFDNCFAVGILWRR